MEKRGPDHADAQLQSGDTVDGWEGRRPNELVEGHAVPQGGVDVHSNNVESSHQ